MADIQIFAKRKILIQIFCQIIVAGLPLFCLCILIQIQTYQGGKQGYNGPGFQWLAFHGSVDRRTFSSSMYTFEDQDKEKVVYICFLYF